ncbi:S-adenosyl-L-methionine-dependent methyltransferase [Trichoderma longibrachiatum ATCC 18648]|uniref:S-adenosyl-L-methionine-dependent methyltransferase n=1 Tax=Trichoderma longibrachiatum ATCC 18648 TaxID=983965 RepID=A0A2T4C6D3_TRILO|nr:S-adenosyl-L-methionine-dependent methyltransferase [Trichoderma longibrachiatum ATCC 18648]
MAQAEDYILGRSYSEGLRLETQHLLFGIHNGSTMNPKIPITPESKIADVGTGTGVWLLELATQVPPTVQLDGFDISDELLPHESNVPSNVHFRIADAFSNAPDDCLEKYDVVHLRLFCCIVRGGNPEKLFQHAYSLLKPGGYLQWDDGNLSPEKLHIKGAEAEAFATFVRQGSGALNLSYSWVGDLPRYAEKAGLDVLNFRSETWSKALIPMATRTYVLGHVGAIAALYNSDHSSLPPREQADALLLELIGSIKKGGVYMYTPVHLLARKPT